MNSLNIKSYTFPSIIEKNPEGILRAFESDDLPFQIKRVFTIVNAQGSSKRGEHAHKKCNQLICCVAGEINLKCDDGKTQAETFLSPETKAVLVPSGIWAGQDYLKDNSVIIVFCDQPYDESDYIRNYDEFIEWKNEKNENIY